MDEQSILKVAIEDADSKTLVEPEYHGDAMGTGGSLVFETSGWNERACQGTPPARAVLFGDAEGLKS